MHGQAGKGGHGTELHTGGLLVKSKEGAHAALVTRVGFWGGARGTASWDVGVGVAGLPKAMPAGERLSARKKNVRARDTGPEVG